MTKSGLLVMMAAAMVGGCFDGGSSSPPDKQLAGRFEDMCKIARANVETPVKGVKKLGRYLDKHAGDLLGAWGDTLAAIERIPDDRKHDDRARVARDRISKPLRACERDWMRFGEAVEANPEASELVERFSIRLNRTFEIIFSGADRRFDLLRLPARLDGLIANQIDPFAASR